jgi:glycosyltransferase involved in cell wall biosynthesis
MSPPRIRSGITAVIPSIPPRVGKQLHRALDSVLMQTRPVDAISVSVDHGRRGSALNRTRALSGVGTEWVALLDDDDEWMPEHVGLLMQHAIETGADVVYPWFDIPEVPWGDPWPEREGQPFDEELLRKGNYIPITVLARTELLWAAGGFTSKDPENPDSMCDDWGTWERLLASGAKFSHLNRRTWLWHWWGGPGEGNTSGRPIW